MTGFIDFFGSLSLVVFTILGIGAGFSLTRRVRTPWLEGTLWGLCFAAAIVLALYGVQSGNWSDR